MLSTGARNPCCATLVQRSSSALEQFRPSLLLPLLLSSSSSSSPSSSSFHHIRHFGLASAETRGKEERSSSPVPVDEREREPPTIDPSRYNQSYTSSSRIYPDVVIGARWKIMRVNTSPPPQSSFSPTLIPFVRNYSRRIAKLQKKKADDFDETSQRAVTTALWCNFLVFSLKFGVWFVTSSHVMLAEMVHSIADFANQTLLAYGLSSSKRAPDAMHPYGYSKERFVWSLISAVGIFCLGSGATIMHGIQHLWNSESPENIHYAALVIGGSFLIEGASLLVAINAVKKGAAAEEMTIWDYVWRGHDPTSVAVMIEDSAAVTGLAIAAASLVAVKITGNPIYDPIGSIIVGNLLGMVAIFLIQRNRHALIGRAIDDHDMHRVLEFLRSDPVVDSLYDCKSEVIGPGFFRFKAEIDFNGVVVKENYLKRSGRDEWVKKFRDASDCDGDAALLNVMGSYSEELIEALGSEVDRLEREIQKIVPGIRHVDIEAHNPTTDPSL